MSLNILIGENRNFKIKLSKLVGLYEWPGSETPLNSIKPIWLQVYYSTRECIIILANI